MDDHLVASIVSECPEVMKDYDTRIKMASCYNLTERILRLFSIQGSEEFHKGVMECIEEYYEE